MRRCAARRRSRKPLMRRMFSASARRPPRHERRRVRRHVAPWASMPLAQSSARRRLPFRPPRWPFETSKRFQSRSPSFRVHVQLRPPSYPIPPLLPQLAESPLKVSQMLVLNHFPVLSPLSDGRGSDVTAVVTGHRHGSRVRTLTGTFGKTAIAVPRARLNISGGKTTEWKSQVLRNYQRRTRAADALAAGGAAVPAMSHRRTCSNCGRCGRRPWHLQRANERTRYRGSALHAGPEPWHRRSDQASGIG
jgi:hypothetical protein